MNEKAWTEKNEDIVPEKALIIPGPDNKDISMQLSPVTAAVPETTLVIPGLGCSGYLLATLQLGLYTKNERF